MDSVCAGIVVKWKINDQCDKKDKCGKRSDKALSFPSFLFLPYGLDFSLDLYLFPKPINEKSSFSDPLLLSPLSLSLLNTYTKQAIIGHPL